MGVNVLHQVSHNYCDYTINKKCDIKVTTNPTWRINLKFDEYLILAKFKENDSDYGHSPVKIDQPETFERTSTKI